MNYLNSVKVKSTQCFPTKSDPLAAAYDLYSYISSPEQEDKDFLHWLLVNAIASNHSGSPIYSEEVYTPKVFLNGELIADFKKLTDEAELTLDNLYSSTEGYTILAPSLVYSSSFVPYLSHKSSTKTIGTGVFLEFQSVPMEMDILPCALVLPRSGWAFKHQITVTNSPGLVDCNYLGEIKVSLTNLGKDIHIIGNKVRVAQLLFTQSNTVKGAEVLNKSSIRGVQGFGSSGVA